LTQFQFVIGQGQHNLVRCIALTVSVFAHHIWRRFWKGFP